MPIEHVAGKTMLIFGIGKLGGAVADVLSRQYPNNRFVLVSRSRERSQKRANLAKYLAIQWGETPRVFGEEVDLHDTDRTAELINKYKPDIVLNATTPFPWWKIDSLPEQERILAHSAGPGVWCALDCILPMRLTESLSMADSNAVHVNACYPDMTNAFLSGLESRPSLGIGNISNLVPGLKLAFASKYSVSPKKIEIQIVGHHYVCWNAPSNHGCHDAPYHLTVTHPNGVQHFRGPSDVPFEILRQNATRVRGLAGLGVTIGSATTLLSAFFTDNKQIHHSPGAKGLPGGYPVIIGDDGNVNLHLPNNLSEQQAIAINTIAQNFDGILHVEAGTVSATPNAQDAYSKIIGNDLPTVTLSNVFDISKETLDRLDHRFKLNL